MTDWQNILGALSFVLTVMALHILGSKDRKAFVIFSMSCALQLIIFCYMRWWFLAAQMIVIIYYNIRNYVMFGRRTWQQLKFEKKI